MLEIIMAFRFMQFYLGKCCSGHKTKGCPRKRETTEPHNIMILVSRILFPGDSDDFIFYFNPSSLICLKTNLWPSLPS